MMFSRLTSDIPQNFRDFWSTSETKIASVTKLGKDMVSECELLPELM